MVKIVGQWSHLAEFLELYLKFAPQAQRCKRLPDAFEVPLRAADLGALLLGFFQGLQRLTQSLVMLLEFAAAERQSIDFAFQACEIAQRRVEHGL